MLLLQMGKMRYMGDLVKSRNTSSPASSPRDSGKPREPGFAGMQNPAPVDAGIPSAAPLRSRASLPPPRSRLLFKGNFLGTLLWERALGRKCREPLSSGRQQTRRIGNTYCNSSKIRYTFYTARSRTHHTAGSQSRLLTDKGSETPFLSGRGLRFDAMGIQDSRGVGDAAPRNPAQRENQDTKQVLHRSIPASHTDGHPHRTEHAPPAPHQHQPNPNTPGFWSQQWENFF